VEVTVFPGTTGIVVVLEIVAMTLTLAKVLQSRFVESVAVVEQVTSILAELNTF
jgi:hypothetical protein